VEGACHAGCRAALGASHFRLTVGSYVAVPMSTVLAVEATEVTKRYGDLVAVDAVTMHVEQGEVYGVLGPNGAGKTTLLRMLFGLIRPDAGTISLFGRTHERDEMRFLDGVAGFIESPKFYPYLSGRRNLEGLAILDGGAPPGRLEEVLDIVDLADRADDRVGGYSFGMRQRLGVAASLLRDPRLLILDEPANGLDPAGMRDMRALIKRLAASGLTVLLSSHDMLEVEEICDNVTIMRTGSVVFHGEISELREQAPEQGHRIRTDDDDRAFGLAGRHRDLRVERTGEAGLAVYGDQSHVDAYVAALVSCGLAVRGLELTEAPLEALFFMLTESAPGGVPVDLDRRPAGAAR
jgi:ABC-2 type transport system ATP-binding protein